MLGLLLTLKSLIIITGHVLTDSPMWSDSFEVSSTVFGLRLVCGVAWLLTRVLSPCQGDGIMKGKLPGHGEGIDHPACNLKRSYKLTRGGSLFQRHYST